MSSLKDKTKTIHFEWHGCVYSTKEEELEKLLGTKICTNDNIALKLLRFEDAEKEMDKLGCEYGLLKEQLAQKAVLLEDMKILLNAIRELFKNCPVSNETFLVDKWYKKLEELLKE